MTLVRTLLLLALPATLLQAAGSAWLERVEPVITAAEKKTYLGLPPEDRTRFEDSFWNGKAITGDEYFKRFAYIDSMFGSKKTGSGANTDQGRVYLSLGAPNRITNLPSSRIFVPLEIWYYDIVPGVLNTELRVVFYQPQSVGFKRLYSPTGDTIRALLLPQAATRSMFGPNDSVSESDIRRKLMVPPAEDEVVTAAVNIANGIRYTGNDEILGKISSPLAMLSKPPRADVRSRLILTHPKLEILQTKSPYAGIQLDLALDAQVERELNVEVVDDLTTIYQNQLHLKFQKPEPVHYTHRLDLLPGQYRILITIDGRISPYPVTVKPQMGDILRADRNGLLDRRQTPFEFEGEQLELTPSGRYAMVSLPNPEKVIWMLRHGSAVVWRTTTDATELAIVTLPTTGIPSGTYTLEAVTPTDNRNTELIIRSVPEAPPDSTALSFNANLAPSQRLTAIGHQYLLRNNIPAARALLIKATTPEAQIELARADALEGHLDQARDRVKSILATNPNNIEALSTYAYIETRFQDYEVAADLYRRALTVQDSPAIRAALAQLPVR